MKNIKVFKRHLCAGRSRAIYSVAVLTILLVGATGCNKQAEVNSMDPTSAANQSSLRSLTGISPALGNIQQVNLVADAGLGAARQDPNLVNAWGIAMAPDESMWISSNGKGLAVIYAAQGNQIRQSVHIPGSRGNSGAAPTGVVYAGEQGIMIPGSQDLYAKYLFATEDGIIAAWTGGDTARTVIDMGKSGAVYKGIALANSRGTTHIYATDFHNGKVDVFDLTYAKVSSMPFTDPNMPQGYAPFGIANIDGKIFVTYAMQDGAKNNDLAGAGNGFVDVYSTEGTLEMRFASQGVLNSPWGLAETETQGNAEHILVGNSGDGHISVFDTKGTYVGQLGNSGKPLAIEGLWGIAFNPDGYREFEHGGSGVLYFTAGPGKESHGLFGYLKPGTTAPETPPVSKANQIAVPSSWRPVPR